MNTYIGYVKGYLISASTTFCSSALCCIQSQKLNTTQDYEHLLNTHKSLIHRDLSSLLPKLLYHISNFMQRTELKTFHFIKNINSTRLRKRNLFIVVLPKYLLITNETLKQLCQLFAKIISIKVIQLFYAVAFSASNLINSSISYCDFIGLKFHTMLIRYGRRH